MLNSTKNIEIYWNVYGVPLRLSVMILFNCNNNNENHACVRSFNCDVFYCYRLSYTLSGYRFENNPIPLCTIFKWAFYIKKVYTKINTVVISRYPCTKELARTNRIASVVFGSIAVYLLSSLILLLDWRCGFLNGPTRNPTRSRLIDHFQQNPTKFAIRVQRKKKKQTHTALRG